MSRIEEKIEKYLNEGNKKKLTKPEKHQLKVAKDTLKMNDVGASVMGGMTKKEAREFLKKVGYTDKEIKKIESS